MKKDNDRGPRTWVKSHIPIAFLFMAGLLLAAVSRAQTPIPDDSAVFTDSISAGETDSYSFVAEEDDFVLITVVAINGTSFLPRIELSGPGINPPRVTQGNNNDVAFTDFRLEGNGSHTISISAVNPTGAGDYRLDFSLVPGANDGGTLPDALLETGTLTPGEVRAFQFVANANEHVIATLTDVGLAPPATNFSPRLQLIDPEGKPLDISVNSGGVERDFDVGGISAWANEPLVLGGTYTLLISDGAFIATGEYRLDFTKTPITNDGSPALQSATQNAGSLDVGEVLAYQFEAEAGNSLVAAIGGKAPPFTPITELFGPDGSRVDLVPDPYIAPDPNDPTPQFLENAFTAALDTSGTYTLVVADNDYKDPGDFVIDFNPVPGANDGGSLTNGVTEVGQLDAGEIIAYQFDGSAGNHLVVTLTDTNDGTDPDYRPRLELFAPDGSLMGSDAVSNLSASFNVALPDDGTYTLLVSDRRYERPGDFRLDLSVVPGAADGGSLQSGVPVDQSLLPGEVRAFQYTASSGDIVALTLTDTASDADTNNFSPRLEVYDPDGTQIFSESNSVQEDDFERLMVDSGVFTVLVSHAAYTRAGDFQLIFNNDASMDGGVLQSEASQTIQINAGETVAYRFAASDNSGITLDISNLSGALVPLMRLFDPSGLEIASDSGASADINRTLEADGIYTLLFSDLTSTNAGQFDLDFGGATPLPGDGDGDLQDDASDNCPSLFNPTQADNDGDGDGDACDDDDDNDGLSDEDEATAGTNPFNADSDGDGFSDLDELEEGSNPLDGEDQPSSSGLNLIFIIEALKRLSNE